MTDLTTLTYLGTGSATRTRDPVAGEAHGFDMDQTLGVEHGVASGVLVIGRVQDRRSFVGAGGVARTDTVSGELDVKPIPTLSHALVSGWQTTRGPNQSTDATFVTLANNARVYPTLWIELDAGYTLQTDHVLLQSGDRRSLLLQTTAQLTPATTLILTSSWSVAVDTSTPILPGRDDLYSADLNWRASRQLSLGAYLGWLEGRATGLQQRYRIYWDPFVGGAVRLTLTYDDDIDALSGLRSRRVVLAPSWRLNAHMSLDVSYSLFSQNTGQNPRTDVLYVTFTATL
jgi:hypothetical protein